MVPWKRSVSVQGVGLPAVLVLVLLCTACSGSAFSAVKTRAAQRTPTPVIGLDGELSTAGTGPQIRILEQPQSVPLYGKFEVVFAIEDTVASNLQFPYDPDPPPGVEGRAGITVDGLFLPPGESDWFKALVQPAFLYQPYLYEDLGGHDWIYPDGEPVWLLRFAAQRPGTWRYRIRAQDASNCPRAAAVCAEWAESTEATFAVQETSNGNPGFVGVSSRDARYFEFSDGQPFIGVGHGTDFSSLVDARRKLARFSESGINFVRVWMSASVIFGRGYYFQQWDPWSHSRPTTDEVADGSDFSARLDSDNPCMFYWQGDAWPAFEADKTYSVRVRAKLVGVAGPEAGGQPSGLAVTFNRWWDDICASENVMAYLTQDADGHPRTDSGTQDWHWFEGQFTNTEGRFVAGHVAHLVIGLVDTTEGEVYLDEITIGEDLGGGRLGPNIVGKGRFNYHTYFDQGASWFWDQIVDEAAAQHVYLKLVTMDKNDGVFNQINLDGTYDADLDVFDWNENFHAQPGTRVRRLHEYYWRYLIARWGYATAVHSWELLNEGAPDCGGVHMQQAQAFTDYMRTHDPNQHLTATSFWAGHPDCYYGRDAPFTPAYADVHAYVTVDGEGTGWLDVDARDLVAWREAYGAELRATTDMPVVWGEFGIASEDNTDGGEDPRLMLDTEGVWLHNQTWSWLDPNALHTLYWYGDSLEGNDLYAVYRPFRDFMEGIPLTNGHYEDVAATVSNPGLRVVGQRDARGLAAHFWVQNKGHTWWNVVQGTLLPPQSGSISLSGLQPGTFVVERWDTGLGRREERWSVEVDGSGELVIDQGELVSDTAYKVTFDPG